MNFSFTIIELIGGMLTNSVAIFSDAVHDLGDSLSLALAWYFQRKSQKGRTERYTYGYKRFSLLGAIITWGVLLAGSLYILAQAVPRLLHPQETDAGGMFLLALIGIAANGFAALRTRKSRSINERMVSLHLLEDVMGWAAVLIGSAVMYFTGWTIVDPILSIGIAVFVLYNVIQNVRQIMPILLQGALAEFDQEHIAEKLKALEPIEAIHDLHIWSLDEEYSVLTVHVVLSKELPMEALALLKCEIRAVLREEKIRHVTIEFEAPTETCDSSCA